MKKKMRYYLPLLAILWIGAFAQAVAQGAENFLDRQAVNALQQEGSVILAEKEYNRKMSQSEMEREARFLLASYQGEWVKEVYGENFYSLYGFSDKIESYVVSDGEKINLNLVITYDEEKDVSHIIWATPFLNEDF